LKNEESNYDLIFSDVLGHYLTDEQMERLPVLEYALADKGIILLRDMAEYGDTDNEKKELRRTGEISDRATIEFGQWLEKELGFSIPNEEIQQMRESLFAKKPPHEDRQFYLANWLDYLFAGTGVNMQLLYRGLTISSTAGDSRIFPILAFQKTGNREDYNFITNLNGASMALYCREIATC
jgi:hypothetical protein